MNHLKMGTRTVAAVLFVAAGFSQREPANLPLGGPLPGLTAADVALFEAGRADFLEVEAPADGLGPAFNGRSCAECHAVPAIGGIGNQSVTRAGSYLQGQFREPNGGSLIHKFSNPDHKCQPLIPANATVVQRGFRFRFSGTALWRSFQTQRFRRGRTRAGATRTGSGGEWRW